MSGKPLSRTKFMTVFSKCGGRCWYCGTTASPTIDHINPGRDNSLENLVIACKSCNSRKKNASLDGMRHRQAQHILGMPRFSQEQIAWLRARGFDLSEYDGFLFWGERA